MAEREVQPPLRFQRPTLPDSPEVERYFELSREERWFSNGGPCWRLLRDRLADRVGAYCLPVASGTAGLMAAVAALLEDGRAAGTAALMPSFTFPATAQAALWAGLRPRLIDIDAGHWHLDAERLEQALRAAGGAAALAVGVSTFGTPPPAETRSRWERACGAAGIPLLLDSAAAFGAAADDGQPVGAGGDAEVVSFHATKPFAIGEGGAVFTRRRDIYERIELVVNFGLGTDHSQAFAMGLNAKMSELHAATALAVLDRIDEILATRRRSVERLRARARASLSWQEGSEHSTWQFVPVAFPDGETRREAVEQCRGQIEVRTYYEPLHTLAPLRDLSTVDGALDRTDDLHSRLLCLPMANDLSDAELDAIGAPLNAREAPPLSQAKLQATGQ